MKRIDSALRAGVAFVALTAVASAAGAQSTQPPADVITGQAPRFGYFIYPAAMVLWLLVSQAGRRSADQPDPALLADESDLLSDPPARAMFAAGPDRGMFAGGPDRGMFAGGPDRDMDMLADDPDPEILATQDTPDPS